MRRVHSGGMMLTVLLAAALSACSSGDAQAPRASVTPQISAHGAPTATTAPVGFTGAGVPMPDAIARYKFTSNGALSSGPLPVTLYGTTAYVATPSTVIAVDTANGQTTAVLQPPDPANYGADGTDGPGNPAQPPLEAIVDGIPSIIVPVAVSVGGHGTTVATPSVDIMIIDPGRNTITRTISVPVPPPSAEPDLHPIQVVGVAAATAILTYDGATYAVNLASGTLAWHRPAYVADTVGGGYVVGVSDPSGIGVGEKVMALDPATGTSVWSDTSTTNSITVQAGGPRYIVVTGQLDGYYYKIVDAVDGTPIESGHAKDPYQLTCFYDQETTTACSMPGGAWTSAFDAGTGRWLWQLPDTSAHRAGATITAAWRGEIYATAGTEHEPVILDARTGSEHDNISVAPMVVDGYVGIGISPTPGAATVQAFTATR